MKKKLAILIAACVVAVSTATAFLIIGNQTYLRLTRSPRSQTPEAAETAEEGRRWFESHHAEQLTFVTDDGLTLAAQLIRNPNASSQRNWLVILLHGYGSSADDMWQYASYYTDLGCSVLVPDSRGHGDSEGDAVGMGWTERKDLLSWIHIGSQQLKKTAPPSVLLHGVSMGAATICAAGDTLPKQVKGIVCDSAYSCVGTIFSARLKSSLQLPTFPFLQAAELASVCKGGCANEDFTQHLSGLTVPILFLHGSDDDMISPSESYRLAHAANNARVYLLYGVGHAAGLSSAPDTYRAVLDDFLYQNVSRDLLPEEPPLHINWY